MLCGYARPCMALLCALITAASVPTAVDANDSAASTTVGGLKLTHEARVSIQKERLTIGEERVRVEYEFLNETESDIAIEIALPIPEYHFEPDDLGAQKH
jgi:Domain of unknown function (DUF4424)